MRARVRSCACRSVRPCVSLCERACKSAVAIGARLSAPVRPCMQAPVYESMFAYAFFVFVIVNIKIVEPADRLVGRKEV